MFGVLMKYVIWPLPPLDFVIPSLIRKFWETSEVSVRFVGAPKDLWPEQSMDSIVEALISCTPPDIIALLVTMKNSYVCKQSYDVDFNRLEVCRAGV
jgi:hypothetical protein